MSEEYLPHIFEEFTREHTSTEQSHRHRPRLPIVKALVEWMHAASTCRASWAQEPL
ncbi:MAG: ATP-binding protein [Faecalibacterium prausnitzii]